MMKSFVLATAATTAAAKVVDLKASNWKSEVTDSGKGALVMFMAPWCGHCKALKPDWEKLGKKQKNNPAVVIGMVDCTQEEQLCASNGVKGYPTLKYWKAGKTGAKDYQQGRDLAALTSFVESTFKALCDPKTQKGCNKMEIDFIEKNKEKTREELEAIQKEKEAELKEKKTEKKEEDAKRRTWDKKYKSKETSLKKASSILKNMIAHAPKAEL